MPGRGALIDDLAAGQRHGVALGRAVFLTERAG